MKTNKIELNLNWIHETCKRGIVKLLVGKKALMLKTNEALGLHHVQGQWAYLLHNNLQHKNICYNSARVFTLRKNKTKQNKHSV